MPDKYQISSSPDDPLYCKRIPVAQLVPTGAVGHIVPGLAVNDEQILKRFFNAIGINEFTKVIQGVQSRDYFYQNKELCDFILSNAYQARNPKTFINYFHRLNGRITRIENVIHSFKTNVFQPLAHTYTQLGQITNGFKFKGRWPQTTYESFPMEFTQYCEKEIGTMRHTYETGMHVLDESEARLQEKRVWLSASYESLKQGIIQGYLTDPSKAASGLKLFIDIMENMSQIEIGLTTIIKERVKFVVYKHREGGGRWKPGKKTVKLLHCIRNILESELTAAHLFVHESEKEAANEGYVSQYLPTDGPRQGDAVQYYHNYRDALLHMKSHTRYISWLDRQGVVVFNEPIFK